MLLDTRVVGDDEILGGSYSFSVRFKMDDLI